MTTQGIYQIVNLKNNKIYIGASINIERRLIEHKRKLTAGRHPNEKLQNDFIIEDFEFKILEIVEDKNWIKEREEHFIHLYESSNLERGYNLTDGSGYSPTRTHSSKTAPRKSIAYLIEEVERLRDALHTRKNELYKTEIKLRETRSDRNNYKNKYYALTDKINTNSIIKEALENQEELEHEMIDSIFEEMYN